MRINPLVVVIGARGTGKTRTARALASIWRDAGMTVVTLDGSKAQQPEELDEPLAAALNCEPTVLDAHCLVADDRIVRVIVDRCEGLHDRPWLPSWQERWRSLLTSQEATGRLSAVFFGRPLFREIAGGNSSPLMNAGPVVTTEPLNQEEIKTEFNVGDACASALLAKTGGHPRLTAEFLEAAGTKPRAFGRAVEDFAQKRRQYLFRLVEDHSVDGRALFGELLEHGSPIHEGALIEKHFGEAHANGLEAVEDLAACGLIERTEAGDCTLKGELFKHVEGLRSFSRAPVLGIPPYDSEVMSDGSRLVFEAENRLRQVVADRLNAVDSAWWISHVPAEVRGQAEGRQKAESAWAAVEEIRLHPIMYLNLGELFDLIHHSWSRVFATAFGMEQAALRVEAAQLERLRNRIAHSRPISSDQLTEMKVTVKRLGLV